MSVRQVKGDLLYFHMFGASLWWMRVLETLLNVNHGVINTVSPFLTASLAHCPIFADRIVAFDLRHYILMFQYCAL